ncbi:MAG: DNA cytosine methyltransferase, partial [Bacteroidaceae bacterium]|nr:DNA cytosine methyltransferase [Bacteroidaceae bacterium]
MLQRHIATEVFHCNVVGVETGAVTCFAQHIISDTAIIERNLVYAHFQAGILLLILGQRINDKLDVQRRFGSLTIEPDVGCRKHQGIYIDLSLQQFHCLHVCTRLIDIYQGITCKVADKNLFQAQIIEAIEGLGYTVKFGILNAADFGVPQSRERAIFICSKHR